jgi:hypothetical protein
MAAGDACRAAEEYVARLSAARPDGFSIDSRDLPGYQPPTPLRTGDTNSTGRDRQGHDLDWWERMLQVSSPSGWPPVW